MPGPVVGEDGAHARCAAVASTISTLRGPAAAVDQGVAGQLAGRGDQLGLVDQGQLAA